MNWLKKPYYTPAPDLRADIRPTSVNGWNTETNALSIEGYVQTQITSTLSSVDSWLDPTYYNPLGKSSEEIVAAFVWDIMNRIRFYPSLGAGIDPVSLGTKYGQLFVGILKQINSGDFKGGSAGVSLWDAWVKMV